ncbi:MAG: hypothetical protein ACAH95_03175 [Fimbriimonas sp.]
MSRALLFGALLLAGCNRTPAVHVKNVPEQAPPSWTMAHSPDGKVSIAVAPGWRYGVDRMPMIDLGALQSSDPEGGKPLEQMTSDMQNSADQEELKELEEMAKRGIVINVISEGTRPIPGEARTRYYVLKTSHGGPISLVEAADIERKHYVLKPKYDTIQLPIGEALRCQAKEELRDGGVRHQISYVVVDGNDMYSLRFVTQESAQTIEAIAEPAAQSLRIKP